MTDEQIIKEYQDFVNSVNQGEKGEIAQGRFGDILDIIIRQKAENKRLLQKLQQAKSEAIKEFAERLKETAYSYSDISGYQSIVVDADTIDNLVKEMAEVWE